MKEILQVVHGNGAEAKAIIETAYLMPNEIVTVSEELDHLGYDFIKTCTGFGPRGVSIQDVELIKSAVTKSKIKASGGIKTAAFAAELLSAGAHRLGTSYGVDILGEINRA